MNPIDVKNQITNITLFLLERNLIIDTNAAIIRGDDLKSEVTWATASGNLFEVQRRDFASITEYRVLIENRQYHVMMFDGSAFQFRFLFSNDELSANRLCFFPAPFRYSMDDLNSIDHGYVDYLALFDLYLEREIYNLRECLNERDFSEHVASLRLSTPLRFEYDPVTAEGNIEHSPSHLHLLHKDFRWPVFGPLSIGHFVRLIFRRFYPEIWSEFSFSDLLSADPGVRSIRRHELEDLFIECRSDNV